MLASVPKDLFGGGTGAGISIQPVGFLVVQNGDVRLLQMTEGNGDTANNLIRTLPEVISKVSGLVKSKRSQANLLTTQPRTRKHHPIPVGTSAMLASVPKDLFGGGTGAGISHSARGLLSRIERRCSPAPDD